MKLCPLCVNAPWFYTFSAPTRQVNQILLALLLSLTLTVPILVPLCIIEGKHFSLGFFFYPREQSSKERLRTLHFNMKRAGDLFSRAHPPFPGTNSSRLISPDNLGGGLWRGMAGDRGTRFSKVNRKLLPHSSQPCLIDGHH